LKTIRIEAELSFLLLILRHLKSLLDQILLYKAIIIMNTVH
jgi:hypothetical protein